MLVYIIQMISKYINIMSHLCKRATHLFSQNWHKWMSPSAGFYASLFLWPRKRFKVNMKICSHRKMYLWMNKSTRQKQRGTKTENVCGYVCVCAGWGCWLSDGLSVHNLYAHTFCCEITGQRSLCLLIHVHGHAHTCTCAHGPTHTMLFQLFHQHKGVDQSQPTVAQWCHWSDEDMASEEFDVILFPFFSFPPFSSSFGFYLISLKMSLV